MTRYAVKRSDGRYLTLVEHDGKPLIVWLDIQDPPTHFGSWTEANLIAMDPDGANLLRSSEAWSVVPVSGDPL